MSNENKDNIINNDEDNNHKEEDIASTNAISQINILLININQKKGLLFL